MSLATLCSQSTVTAQTLESTRGDTGGVTNTWSDTYTDVPARVTDADANTQDVFQRMTMVVTHTIYTQQAGIGVGMRIVESGLYYLVRSVRKLRAIGGIDDYYVIQAEEQKGLV